MDSKEYEIRVKEIAGRINDIIGGDVETLWHDKIEGASGYIHTIDVSARYKAKDGKPVLRLFECKLRGKNPVSPEEIMIFHDRIIDIHGKDPTVLVIGNFFTTIRYTRGTKKLADFYEIDKNVLNYNGEAYIFSFDGNAIILAPEFKQTQLSESAHVQVI